MNELVKANHPVRERTLANAVIEFLDVAYRDRHWRSKKDAQSTLEEFEIFVGKRQIDRKLFLDWDEYQGKRGLMNSTINKKRIHIKKFLRWCGEWGYMKDPPVHSVILRREPPKPMPRIFTDDEYERIKEATVGTHAYFMTVVARNTGMSMIDVCHLRWACIDMENLNIQVNRIKTSWQGQHMNLCKIPILANSDLHILLQELQARHIEGEWVNPELRFHYSANDIQVVMKYKRLLKELGIERKSFKNWRNTFVSMLVNSNVNMALAMQMTGHKSTKIFAAYARPDWDALRNGLQSAMQWQAGKETVKQLRKTKPND